MKFQLNLISLSLLLLYNMNLTQELNLVKNLDEYTGYKDVTLSDEEMSYFYLHTNENMYDSLLNEYLIIRKSDGEVVDYRKWNGEEYSALSYKQIKSNFNGRVKPRNPQQVLAFDMLQNSNETIKIISGKFGSGKDFLMIANALKLIEDGKFDKFFKCFCWFKFWCFTRFDHK